MKKYGSKDVWKKSEVELPPGACEHCGGEGQVHATCAPTSDNPDGVTDEICSTCAGSGLARSPIREQVIAFHKKFVPDQGIGEGPPRVPGDEMVRFRLMILFEEAFELLDACTCDTEAYKADRRFYESVRTDVGSLLNIRMIDVDIVEVADALADIDSVSEGMRLAFGIDGRPIADEVFRSNWSKTAPTEGAHKLVKGPGYFPPDVEGQLKKQGWVP